MAGSLALGSPYGGTAKPKQHIYQHHVGRPAIYIIYMAFVPHIIQCSVDICVAWCCIASYGEHTVIGAQQGAGLSIQLRQLQDFIGSVRVRSSDDKKIWFIKLVDKKRGQLKMDTARDAMGTSFD